MTKFISLFLTSTSITPIVPVATLATTNDTTSLKTENEVKQDKQVSFKKQISQERQNAAAQEKENWKKIIAQNRRQLNSLTKYQYDNKEFYSKDALNEYMLKNNRIGQKVTSSNPNKIIKDTENMILDNSKIYDADLDNAQQLYRDAFGNIAYSREDALATYITDNSAKVKFSYTGLDNDWFDSPTEAETQVKYGLKINRSLYYQFNGRYYNAFNREDNNALLDSFAHGYFASSSEKLDGSIRNAYEIYSSQDGFYNAYGKEIKEDFRRNYFKDVVDLEQDYAINIENNSCSGKQVGCYIVDSDPSDFQSIVNKDVSGYTIDEKYRKKELTFHFKPSETITSSEDIVNKFEDDRTRYEVRFNAVWRGIYYKDFDDGYGKVHRLLWIQGAWWGLGRKWETGLPSGYKYSDGNTTTLKVYLNAEAKRNKDQNKVVYESQLQKPIYNIKELSPDTKERITDEWYKSYYNKVVANFSETRLECENSNSDQCKSDYTSKTLTFDDLKNDAFVSNGVVFKDKVYNVNNDIGYYYSVIKSWYDFKLVKQKLLNNPTTMSDGSLRYQLRPDLLVTKEELDDFLPLNGSVNARIMYSFIEDDPHLSSRDGTLLANTSVEAKNKSFLLQNHTLRKKYIANDVFNKSEISYNSDKAAIDKLRHNELLTSKFVNKKEIEEWAKQGTKWQEYKRSWDSIISDGRYTVYYIYNQSSNQEIYFPSLELALKALSKEVKETKILESQELNIYVYDYIDQNGNIIPVNFENDDFDQVIETIQRFKN